MSAEGHRPPIRVALLGLGRTMLGEHCAAFKAHPELFKVVAACDLLKERRDIVAADFPECRMFRRYDDMLYERDIDLVDVATCSADHVKHAMQSLDRGLWTLVETPFALTMDDAQLLRGAVAKARNRFLVLQRGIFAPDFMLAQRAVTDLRLGDIYEVVVRSEDYVRRDDWQAVKRLGGGAAYYAMTDLVLQALKLLPMPPIQMWSDLKRIASLGDAEDYVHVNLRTRGMVSADIEFNGGVLPPDRGPSFVIKGSRGTFSVMPGRTDGVLRVVNPDFAFPRRRSSVRTPPLEDLHEDIPVVEVPVSLEPGMLHGRDAFWRHVYDTVRTAAPFPVTLEESIEAVKFVHLMKRTSPFGK